MSDAAVDSLAEQPVPRPSRQGLVVPPRHPRWPVAIGALASAAAGFGLVFALGLGSRRPAWRPLDPAPTVAGDFEAPDAALTAELPAPDSPAAPLAASHDSTPQEDPSTEIDAAGDRYAARPAAHLALAAGEVSAAADRPLSRFSSPDLPAPPLEPAVDPDPPAGEQAPPDAEPEDAAEPAAEPAAGGSPPEAEPEPAPESRQEPQPPPPAADPQGGGVNDADGPVVTEPSSAVDPPPAAPLSESSVAAPVVAAPVVAAPPVREPRAADLTEPDPSAAGSPEPAPPGSLPFEEPPAPSRAVIPPPPAAAIPVGLPAASPFAAAPPVVPPAPAVPPAGPVSAAPSLGPRAGGGAAPAGSAPALGYDDEQADEAAAPLAAAAPLQGQGVPGPLQLEGVQAPQVAVEKRGPREVQVGKPARYEIVVRNVGAATAHDVTLRDAIPRGTSLIATTPPAAPAAAEASSSLVWTLGVLPPGGETRVLMELMPEAEGEIGSIASVSFRADATIRSRSTKPAVTIDCPSPQAVRIGGDVPVTVTVSNPGTGIATGVVLESFLPETVSHRAGSELEFDVGQLRPGETKTIDLLLGTRGPGVQPLRLVARADGGIETDLAVPLEVTAPTLELAIDMPVRRFLQRPATCTISMVNSGTAAARAVELAAQLPPGMKFVKANNAGWHDERTHRVLWNLEELPPGDRGSVTVVVIPVQPGEQRIVAAARSTDGPSDQAVHACQVEGLAAVSFQVADSEDPIEVDGLTEYVIRVANEGTKAATGVQVAANLVGDLEPVGAEGPGGHQIENLAVGFEPLAKLGPGEEAVYRIRARGLRAGHQRIQVQLQSADQPAPITKEETTSVYDDR